MASPHSPRWQRARFGRETMRYIHVARVGAAFVCGLLIAAHFPNPHIVWMQISILAVMAASPYTANIATKVRERALGTLIGGLVGVLAVHVDQLAAEWVRLAIQTLGALAGTYLALGRHGGPALVGAVTLVMVANAGDVDTAVWRVFNVTLGAGIGLAFAYLIPTRAGEHALYLLADNIHDLHHLYSIASIDRRIESADTDAVMNRGRQLRALIPAIRRESGIDAVPLDALLHAQRSMLGLIELMVMADDSGSESGAPSDDAATTAIHAVFEATAARLPPSPRAAKRGTAPRAPLPRAHWLEPRLLKLLRDHQRLLDALLPRLARKTAKA